MSKYSEMAYGELQAEAKKLGLVASGTKEALLERLEAHNPAETPVAEDETVEEDSVEAVEEEETEEETPAPAKKAQVTDREIEKGLRTDAQKMKAHLDAQKKVAIMIPLEVGVAPEVAEKIPFVVNMNGHRFSIKRGTFVEVPEQVAQMVKERLESEGKIGRDKRIDRDSNTLEALG